MLTTTLLAAALSATFIATPTTRSSVEDTSRPTRSTITVSATEPSRTKDPIKVEIGRGTTTPTLPPQKPGYDYNGPEIIVYDPPANAGTDINSGYPPGYWADDDPNEVDWATVSNRTLENFESKVLSYKNKGYLLNDIEVYFKDGNKRFAGIFHKNTKNKNWAALSEMSAATFGWHIATKALNGLRLIDHEIYVDNGVKKYAGIWIENNEGLETITLRDLSDWDFSQQAEWKKNQGYMVTDFESYKVNGVRFFSAILAKNAKDVGWRMHRDRDDTEFSQDFQDLKDDYRIVDHETYYQGTTPVHNTIWIKNTNKRNWLAKRKLSEKTYNDTWYRNRDAGYRPQNFIPYVTDSGIEYSTVWRQNTDRPKWSLKSDIDQIAETFYSDNSLPGLTVGIAKDGEFLYLRGLGKADLGNDVIAHSRTVYRMASVSKAIGGVLTTKLVSKHNDFDFGDSAQTWLPNLPDSHSYTVEQLVSNRSGIGAYAEYDNEPTNTAFTNAWDASQFLITGDAETLPFSVGTYKYSTHGYTPLAAVLEAVDGKDIFDIIEDEINIAYGLSSIRAVKKAEPAPHRAPIYVTNDVNNTLDTPDDISWKVLGGGIESSIYDLTRFGMKLIAGDILTDDELTAMWTPPDNQRSYAYGWDVGSATDKDGISRDVYSKAGGANGSSSYFRLIPEKGIVIAVVTNRRMSPPSGEELPIWRLTSDITAELLSNY